MEVTVVCDTVTWQQ